MRYGSLFSGIGGMDLGLDRAGMTCAWQVEVDPFCRKVLAKHWPDVPKLEDVRDVGKHNLEPVDLIAGGFPCQDISFAGQGAGLAGARSGLWWELARIVGELGPRFVLVENVSALLGRGLGDVLGTMAALGYDAEWHCIPASAVGAPHRRDRLFIVAHAQWMQQPWQEPRIWQAGRMGGVKQSLAWDRNWQDAFSEFRGMDDGLPRSVASTDGYRNAVVPQVAEWIGRRIMEADQHTQETQ